MFKRLAYLRISNNTLACFADHAKLSVFMESTKSLDGLRDKKRLTEEEILQLDGKQIKERLEVRAHVFLRIHTMAMRGISIGFLHTFAHSFFKHLA